MPPAPTIFIDTLPFPIRPAGGGEDPCIYPSSDGKPMGQSDTHIWWIKYLIDNFQRLYRGQNVYVCGDLFWYPVKGAPKVYSAPDTMIVFGRPPRQRSSYRQWEEKNVVPHVTIEVRSENDTQQQMDEHRLFSQRHGVREHIAYDPFRGQLEYFRRSGNRLRRVRPNKNGQYVSKLLGVKFWLKGEELHVVDFDGKPFISYHQLLNEAENAKSEAESAKSEAESAKSEAESAKSEAESVKSEAERLRQILLDSGIDPDSA